MADRIRNLPSSNEEPSDIDVSVMRAVFGDGVVDKSLHVNKIIITVIVFVVLSLPVIDSLLKKVVPDSQIMIMFIKSLIFAVIIVVVQLTS